MRLGLLRQELRRRPAVKPTLVYQPADRFRALQWTEIAVCGVLTLGLTGLGFRWIRRRVS